MLSSKAKTLAEKKRSQIPVSNFHKIYLGDSQGFLVNCRAE